MLALVFAFPTLLVPQNPTQPPDRPAVHVAPAPATTVRFDRPMTGGPLWALGHAWKASFDGSGCTVIPFFGSDAPRNYPLRLELARATVGGEPLVLPAGQPRVDRGVVQTDRGALVERIDTTLDQLEQSFVFATLPNRGAVVVDLTVTTELGCTPAADGLVFANERGRVTYRQAVAVDADGTRLPLAIQWTGQRVRLEIPASFVAKARLPLVLDPVLQFSPGYAPFVTNLQREPDVATIQSVSRSCVLWRRQWSVVDQDCHATILAPGLFQATTLLDVDFTTASWSAPAIAASNWAQNWVVVSQVDVGAASWISGRVVRPDGSMDAQFEIERSGVVGLPGNNYRPDIGGDPYPGAAAFYTVVWEHETTASNHDIHYKQLNQDGSLRTQNPFPLDASATNESWPSISRSNWQADWFVIWQRTYSAVDEDLVAAQLGYSGVVQVGPHYVSASVRNELQPSVSSPAFLVGNRYALAAWQTDFNGGFDITCKVIDQTGGLWASTNLSAAEAGGAYQIWNEIQPDVDSDGVRFVVASMEQYGGLTYDTNVTTVAFLPQTGLLRIDEEHVVLGSSPFDESSPRICADFSGGAVASPRYLVVHANHGSNDTEVIAYAGHAPGALFTTLPTSCGGLSITPSGTPAAGSSVTFTVGNGFFSGTILGFPGFTVLTPLGCNCVLGVANGILFGNPLVWTVPADPGVVGIQLAVQGFTFIGTQCLGFVDLSDTVNFTIR